MFRWIKRLIRRKKDYEEQIRLQDMRITELQDENRNLRRQIDMIVGMYPDADQQPCPPPPKGVNADE